MKQSKAIIALAHVCQYWRATILSNPKFWTSVDLTSYPFEAADLLERSGSMPIIAAFMTPDPDTPVPPKEVLLQHSSRIQRVHIHASYQQLMDFLSNLCGHSPILEAVEIQSGSVFDGGRPIALMWGEEFKLPMKLKDAPNLKSLRVSEMRFSNCFLELHHLTHLELSQTFAQPHSHLAIISANPMLEVVILSDMVRLRPEEDVDYDAEVTVSLPHLPRMELYRISTSQLLMSLIFPLGTHLSWYCFPQDSIPPSESLRNIFKVQKAHFTFTYSQGKQFIRSISGYGPNGTFRHSIEIDQLDFYIHGISLGSLEELSISKKLGIHPTPDDIVYRFLQPSRSSFNHLRVLIVHRVAGCKKILQYLSSPNIYPELHTVVLADYQSHTEYWPSLVTMARIRNQDQGSNDIRRVDIFCKENESPKSHQLAELRAHVFLVQIKPWDCEVEQLDWFKDPRFKDLGRL